MDRERHAFLALVILVELEALEGGSTGDQLVGELGLVLVALIALVILLVVDLLMSILSIVCRGERQPELARQSNRPSERDWCKTYPSRTC